MLQWMLTGLAAVVAVLAYWRGRRLGRRLDVLSHSYWELRYEFTSLRARVARLDPAQPESGSEGPAQASSSASFVPLSALRAKS